MTPPIAIVWLNGRLVPSAEAMVPANDRGLLYGDSIFESVPVRHGRPFRWEAHLDRLDRGAEITGIRSGLDRSGWRRALDSLLEANSAECGVVRMTVTRGPGPRGYSPRSAGPPTVLLTWHPTAPPSLPHPGWRLLTSRFRLIASDPLAGTKHGSRLLNVLARAEAEAAGADEALLLNSNGHVAECASGNIFWVKEGCLMQPPPESGALHGVTAEVVLEMARDRGLETGSEHLTSVGLADRGGAFLTLSSLGIVPVLAMDGTPMPAHPLITELARSLHERMDAECAHR